MMTNPWLARRAPGAPLAVTVGCMNFGGRTSADESTRIVHRALERGVAAFDVANVYNGGESERLLGRALRGREAFVATKCGLDGLSSGKPEGLGRETVLRALDASLARLGVGSVALYYLHSPDRATPFAETLDALEALRGAGKLERFAVSNYSSWEVLETALACDERGAPRPAASQVIYNAAIRQIELEHLRFCARYSVHVTVYNPLAGGLLAGRATRGAAPEPGSRLATNRMYKKRYLSDRMLAFAEAIKAIADGAGRTMADVAYGWLAAQERVDSVILGPASVAQLDAALDALARPLPEATLAALADLQRDFDGTDATYAR